MKNKINNKKVVTIGGGSGTFALHSGLKKRLTNISAIVSMVDSGGSTGVLRDELGVLPPGDARKCLVALSEDRGAMRSLFSYRYKKGHLKGESFGNLFISTLEKITGSFERAVLEASKILSVNGKVIPVTLDDANLHAKLIDGEVIVGETNIDIPKHDGNLPIVDLFIKPKARISPMAKKAIDKADLIIIGPGDLFSSICANIVVPGVATAIRKSRAKKVYVCNLMTKFGETNNFAASEFLQTIEKYLGVGVIDYMICHSKKFDKKILARYKKEKAEQVEVNQPAIKKMGYRLINADIAQVKKLIRHDSEKLTNVILKLL